MDLKKLKYIIFQKKLSKPVLFVISFIMYMLMYICLMTTLYYWETNYYRNEFNNLYQEAYYCDTVRFGCSNTTFKYYPSSDLEADVLLYTKEQPETWRIESYRVMRSFLPYFMALALLLAILKAKYSK